MPFMSNTVINILEELSNGRVYTNGELEQRWGRNSKRRVIMDQLVDSGHLKKVPLGWEITRQGLDYLAPPGVRDAGAARDTATWSPPR